MKRRHDFALLCSIHSSLRSLKSKELRLPALGHAVPREADGVRQKAAPLLQAALHCLSRPDAECVRANYEVQTDLQVAASRYHRTVRLPSHAGPKGLSGRPHLQSRTG